MNVLMNLYPGHQAINFFVIIAATVALVSATAWIASLFLERYPAVRYRILFSALIAVLASPLLALVFSASGTAFVTVPLLAESGSSTTTPETRINETSRDNLPTSTATPNPLSTAASPSDASRNSSTQKAVCCPKPTESGNADVSSNAIDSYKCPEVAATTSGSSNAATNSFKSIVVAVLFVWLCGMVFSLAGLLRSSLFLRRLRRSMQEISNTELQNTLDEVKHLVGAKTAPMVMVSRLAHTPLATGLFRPVIVLPLELPSAINRDQLCDVLVHEIAHIERRDNLVVLLQAIARTLFWPIVFVHLLNRQLARAREEVCDNYVLVRRDAVNYGETLLQLAQLACGVKVPMGTVGILHWRGKLEDRIFGLIHDKRSKRTRINPFIAGMILVAFLSVSALLCNTTILSARADEKNKEKKTTDTENSQPAAEAPADLLKIPADGKYDPADPKFAGFFSGRVAGPDGKPLSGARVYIVSTKSKAKDAGTVRAKTDAEGRFAFNAPDLTYTEYDGLPARRAGLLIVMADGYAPDWFDTWGQTTEYELRTHWTPRKGDKFDMLLAKDDVPIHGRFLDPDGKPLAGARVRVRAMMVPRDRDLDAHIAHWSKASVMAGFLTKVPDYMRELYRPELISGLTTETQTDADGRFKLSGIGRDRIVDLMVSAPSIIDTHLEVMTRDTPDVGTFLSGVNGKGKPTQTLYGAGFTMQLKPGRTIKGRVIDRETKKPIPGMHVGPLVNAVTTFSPELYPYVTDSNGNFTISGRDLIWKKETIVAVAASGLPYETAWVEVANDVHEIEIACQRGIPYRLKLSSDDGKPVDAEVSYIDVYPNPYRSHRRDEVHWPVGLGAKNSDGIFEGFVLPGPGAILIKARPRSAYRQARVDPKEFFSSIKVDWAEWERGDKKDAFGTLDTLTTSAGRYIDVLYRGWTINQHDYAAIVLVNPPKGSGPLELSTTAVHERLRQVSLIDSDGKPVEGVQMQFKLPNDSVDGFLLRAASFPLTGLHPDRVKRITFTKEDRKLIGFLAARGDDDTPYTVHMQPWATVMGRIVDENGKPIKEELSIYDYKKPNSTTADADASKFPSTALSNEGRFRIEKLIPGVSYNGPLYRYLNTTSFQKAGTAFENLVLEPGEIRDLGVIRIKLPSDEKSELKPAN